MINPQPQNFNNLGFISCDLTVEEILPLKQEIEEIQNNFSYAKPYNRQLIGNLQKEFEIIKNKNHLQNILLPLIQKYEQTYRYLDRMVILSENVPLVLKSVWVNFQSKTEFNPNHNHDGVFSFVIWIKVPYDIEKEKEFSPGYNSKNNLSGCFEFQYTSILGEIYSHYIHVDKSLENKVILFPSKLSHCVYPFYTSDEFRISVSGNFILEVKN